MLPRPYLYVISLCNNTCSNNRSFLADLTKKELLLLLVLLCGTYLWVLGSLFIFQERLRDYGTTSSLKETIYGFVLYISQEFCKTTIHISILQQRLDKFMLSKQPSLKKRTEISKMLTDEPHFTMHVIRAGWK